MANESLIRLMKMVSNNTKVTVNGQETIFSEMVVKKTANGGTVVMIDGIPAVGDDVDIKIEVNGDVESITLGSGTIICANVTNGINTVSGDINCENVQGNITTTSGDINSTSDISGNVNTISGDINCHHINGDVSTISGDIY